MIRNINRIHNIVYNSIIISIGINWSKCTDNKRKILMYETKIHKDGNKILNCMEWLNDLTVPYVYLILSHSEN